MVNRAKEQVLVFLIGIMIIVIANQIFDRFPLRFDLTDEKRYSISEPSKRLLRSLDDIVYVEVYLEGELPSGFKRLRNSISEVLDEFSVYGGNNVQYKLIDPSLAKSTKARNEFYRSLMDKGLQATNLAYSKDGNKTEKLVFPGVIMSYGGSEQAITLLKGNQASSAEERLNQSIEGLEYELINVLRGLASDRRKRIALVQGHGEPDSLQLAGLTNALLDKYDVYKIDLAKRKVPLEGYDALLITKPTERFSEREKYLLDQYMVKGGKALMFLDALHVNMDSASNEGTYALPYDLNLNELLFRYGVRINQNYVQDIFCGNYPVVTGNLGDQPQVRMLPWPFFPVINTFGDHPIVKNMDALTAKFASNIDTVKAAGIKKTPLLLTSQYSRVISSPVKVGFNDLREDLTPDAYTAGSQNIAYLLEGKFTSLYKNRILPSFADAKSFVEGGQDGALIVCADGDMIRNEFDLKTGDPLELGSDPFSGTFYANKDFVLNSLEYLLNDRGIITAKGKEIKIRPLDKVKVAEDKLFWQVLNLGTPLVFILIYGIGRYYLRKRKYANFK